MGLKSIRENRKHIRNNKIMKRYAEILKRMGDVRHLTPQYEIMDEIAAEFDIEPSTVSRIIKKMYRKK